MYILLMSATWNTVLSLVIGFTLGFLAAAFWYGATKKNKDEFDEQDIYHVPLRKVK